ncbi:hypothetical protein AWC29_24800 [Mycobacterium triplex]|nr:hypothetical protein [Mycobacterium triplex]ORX00462.1 hypothetical protein AWC29_24800 [Mycobacterium triplex]
MKPSLPRRLAALAGLVAMLILAAPPAPHAAADPASNGGAVIEAPTIPLPNLGGPSAIEFYPHRELSVTGLTFSVPAGLNPVSLNAILESPVNLRYGNLTVTQDDRTISRMELPTKDQTPLVIPLAGTKVTGNSVSLTLTATLLPLDNYCWDPLTPIRLVNGSITFAGGEVAPKTVADFLPPVIRKLTIFVPPKPTQQESDAAVQLAAALEDHYGAENPQVAVEALYDRGSTVVDPSQPLERQIIIKEGPDKGLSLQGSNGVPALLISGAGDELTNQTRLLTDPSVKFALGPSAVGGPLPNKQKLAADTTTLEQLNQNSLSAEDLWPDVSISLDQTRWGHSLQHLRVHVIGSHTPLPNNFGGEVLASVAGQTINRWPAEANGTIDRWVDIPDRLLSRSTSLSIKVHTTGDAGHCGEYLPITLKIDPKSEVQTSRANPPIPKGFPSIPQSLMPRIQIGITDDAFNDTVRAAQIMVGLQQLSVVPLATKVTSLKQAIDSRDPAVLISAGAWPVQTIPLPFNAEQGSITIEGADAGGESVSLTLDPSIHFGSLQTAYDGHRSFLIATSNGAPGQLDELLRWLAAEPGRWSQLDGREIISVPGSEPITVANPPSDVVVKPPTQEDHYTWVWWVAGWVVVAAVGGGVLLYRARRNSV